MTKITENTIENFGIQLLEGLGYGYLYGPSIAPDAENPELESFSQMLLLNPVEKPLKMHS